MIFRGYGGPKISNFQRIFDFFQFSFFVSKSGLLGVNLIKLLQMYQFDTILKRKCTKINENFLKVFEISANFRKKIGHLTVHISKIFENCFVKNAIKKGGSPNCPHFGKISENCFLKMQEKRVGGVHLTVHSQAPPPNTSG